MGYHSATGYSVRYAAAIGTLRYGLDLRPGGGWEVRDGWGALPRSHRTPKWRRPYMCGA
jgi:hypothetical protein